jgi:hypothetical protein
VPMFVCCVLRGQIHVPMFVCCVLIIYVIVMRGISCSKDGNSCRKDDNSYGKGKEGGRYTCQCLYVVC